MSKRILTLVAAALMGLTAASPATAAASEPKIHSLEQLRASCPKGYFCAAETGGSPEYFTSGTWQNDLYGKGWWINNLTLGVVVMCNTKRQRIYTTPPPPYSDFTADWTPVGWLRVNPWTPGEFC